MHISPEVSNPFHEVMHSSNPKELSTVNQILHSDEDYFSMGLFIERNSCITCFIYLLHSLTENDASCIRQIDSPVNACYFLTEEM